MVQPSKDRRGCQISSATCGECKRLFYFKYFQHVAFSNLACITLVNEVLSDIHVIAFRSVGPQRPQRFKPFVVRGSDRVYGRNGAALAWFRKQEGYAANHHTLPFILGPRTCTLNNNVWTKVSYRNLCTTSAVQFCQALFRKQQTGESVCKRDDCLLCAACCWDVLRRDCTLVLLRWQHANQPARLQQKLGKPSIAFWIGGCCFHLVIPYSDGDDVFFFRQRSK